jgi:hypothetical protein
MKCKGGEKAMREVENVSRTPTRNAEGLTVDAFRMRAGVGAGRMCRVLSSLAVVVVAVVVDVVVGSKTAAPRVAGRRASRVAVPLMGTSTASSETDGQII